MTDAISSTGSSSTAATTTRPATDPATVGAALVTSLGLGTGINMTTLATQIAGATYADQNTHITSQLAQVQVQISEASALAGAVSSLASSFGTLVDGGGLSATPSVANTGVATATLPPGTSGAASSYSLEVSRLASAQVLTSPTFASAASSTGSGSLTITLGSISNGAFTADSSKTPLAITVPSGATLADVASAINASGGGITAYVATSSGSAQLVIKGATGANSAFTLSASETAGDPGLSAFAWGPSTGDPTRLAESAQDAAFKLDGVAHTSASNTLPSVAPGLSLSLTGTNPGQPTTISYSNPSSGITSAMTNFTAALNTLVTSLNTDTTPSANGSLSNNSGARALARQLSQLAGAVVMPNAAAGAPSTLADLGLTVSKNGSFTLDSAKLSASLAQNPTAVAAMFTNGLHGIYGNLETLSFAVNSASDPGSLAGAVTYSTALQTRLTAQQTALTTQQTTLRTQLIASFASADSSVAESKSTLSYLQEQIAAWNATKTN